MYILFMYVELKIEEDLGKVSFNSLMQMNELFSSREQSNIFLQISHPYTNFPFCRILSVFVSRIFQ